MACNSQPRKNFLILCLSLYLFFFCFADCECKTINISLKQLFHLIAGQIACFPCVWNDSNRGSRIGLEFGCSLENSLIHVLDVSLSPFNPLNTIYHNYKHYLKITIIINCVRITFCNLINTTRMFVDKTNT